MVQATNPMAESIFVLDRHPFFQGLSCFPLSPDKNRKAGSDGFPLISKKDQLDTIFDVIGKRDCPDDVSFITDKKALEYLKSFGFREPLNLSERLPGASP